MCCYCNNKPVKKTNFVCHIWRKEYWTIVPTIGTDKSSSVKQIFHNGESTHDGTGKSNKKTLSTSPIKL